MESEVGGNAGGSDTSSQGWDESHLLKHWGKSASNGKYHALPWHLLDVSAVGVTLLRASPALREGWAQSLHLRPDGLETLLTLGLAVHDIGKFCDRFQALDREHFERVWPGKTPRLYQPHHTTLGSVLLKSHIIPSLAKSLAEVHPWSEGEWRHVLWALEGAFTGHHGQPPEALQTSVGIWDEEGIESGTRWVEALRKLAPLETLWRDGVSAEDLHAAIRAGSWHIAGFAVLCDWVGSNEAWFPRSSEASSLQVYFASAMQRAELAIRGLGILSTPIATPATTREMFRFPPTPLQMAVEAWKPSTGPHLVIMEDTTGSGKTEASLLAVHRIMRTGEATGFYFALPTQATANAMYSRLKIAAPQIFQKPSEAALVLSHSGRLAMSNFRNDVLESLQDRASGSDTGRLECTRWLADSRKKTFLAHVGVGTIDQALLAVLPVKHQSLRLFGLASRVLVVDEVHAYDPHATALLEALLRFHTRAGGSTILLSATLPLHLRDRFSRAFAEECGVDHANSQNRAYPLLTQIDGSGSCKETAIAPREGSARSFDLQFLHAQDDVFQAIQAAQQNGQSVCWIRNTVREAVEAWDKLSDLSPSLIHARFTEADRRRHENELLAWAGPNGQAHDRRGRVLIATQVVEQSLDLDFDLVITDLAPIELLLQRAGRLQRHPGRQRPIGGAPVLLVHAPAWDDQPPANWVQGWSKGTAAVYPDHGRLWLTCATLRSFSRIRIPEDARNLIEAVYGPTVYSRLPPELLEITQRAEAEAMAQQSHAHLKALKLDAGYSTRDGRWEDPDRAKTRAGLESVDLHLATRDPDGIKPLDEEGWDGSRLRISRSVALAAGLIEDAPSADPLTPANVVVLERTGNQSWSQARSTEGRRWKLSYSMTRGFEVKEEK